MVKTSFFRRCLLLLPFLTLATVATINADDGWRRTARGWERTSAWESAATTTVTRPSLEVVKNNPVHPGQLALLQIAGSCLVLGLFAGRGLLRITPSAAGCHARPHQSARVAIARTAG
jgi:hypothetical protein